MKRLLHTAPEFRHTGAEMAYMPLLTIRPADVQPLPVPSYGVALLLEGAPEDASSLDTLIRGHRPFLLVLGPGVSEHLFEYIALCLFSPSYICIGGAPVLAYQGAPPTSLITRLQEQGWSDIVQWNLSLIPIVTHQHDIPDLADAWIASTTSSKYILIKGEDLDDTLQLERALQQNFNEIFSSHSSLRTLILQKQQLQDKLEQLNTDHRTLQERLQNAETTIDVIRHKYKDDYNILFSWYQGQYEVLPLWYKRFGHLLNVLTGRRSVKSLVQSIRRHLQRWRATAFRGAPASTNERSSMNFRKSGPPESKPSVNPQNPTT